jgi:hypothetical protein
MAITVGETPVFYGAAIARPSELPATRKQQAMTTRSTLQVLTFAAIVLGAAALSARAQEVQTGTVMICDTQKQVERFVTLFDGNAQIAISAVNAEEQNPTACAVADIAYVHGPQVGTARSRTEAFGIIPIIAVGVRTPAGVHAIAPAPFYTLVKIKEYAV